MPLTTIRVPQFKPQKEAIVSWNTWRKGLNTLLRENEVDGAEMVSSTNLLLVGSGAPTKRWGSQNYYQAGATGTGRFLMATKDNQESISILSMTDCGILTKKSGASYTPITGASWPSGYNVEAAQLGNKVYFASSQRELTRYNFSNLINFPTLATPTGLAASNLSGLSIGSARGTNTWSWRITAISKSGGETVGSTPVSLTSLPQQLSATTVRLFWTAVSAASGDLTGYNIYRGSSGDETWVGGVDNSETSWDDPGETSSDPFRTVPVADTTGGPKAKYIIRFQDRLVMAGIPGDPTKVIFSGRYPQHERFDWFGGGGFIYIEPDSGESITGLTTYQNNSTQSQTIIVFKEKSVWEVSLATQTFGQYAVLVPSYRLLTASQGCSSHRSIQAVENDIMFANQKGVYILRYEPQLLNVINANEISAKIRPFFEALSNADLTSCCSLYADKKYVLAFPNSDQFIVFDRERLCFVGPWTMPFGIAHMQRYIDADGMERWIGIDSDDNYVTEFSKNLSDDKGTAIRTIFKSKKEDFADWTLFKTLNEVFFNFKSAVGDVSVNIYIEDRSGSTIVAKSFTLTAAGASGTSGFGTDEFGLTQFGMTENSPTPSSVETQKRAFIFKPARTFQVEVRTTTQTSNYELLGVKAVAIPQSRGNAPSAWNV